MAKFLVLIATVVVATAAHRHFRYGRPYGNGQAFQDPFGDWDNEMNKIGNQRSGQAFFPPYGYGYGFPVPRQPVFFFGNRLNRGRNPYLPVLPPFFANVTEEELEKAIVILSDRDLTKQQQYVQLGEWVTAQGTEFAVCCHIQKKKKTLEIKVILLVIHFKSE